MKAQRPVRGRDNAIAKHQGCGGGWDVCNLAEESRSAVIDDNVILEHICVREGVVAHTDDLWTRPQMHDRLALLHSHQDPGLAFALREEAPICASDRY